MELLVGVRNPSAWVLRSFGSFDAMWRRDHPGASLGCQERICCVQRKASKRYGHVSTRSCNAAMRMSAAKRGRAQRVSWEESQGVGFRNFVGVTPMGEIVGLKCEESQRVDLAKFRFVWCHVAGTTPWSVFGIPGKNLLSSTQGF